MKRKIQEEHQEDLDELISLLHNGETIERGQGLFIKEYGKLTEVERARVKSKLIQVGLPLTVLDEPYEVSPSESKKTLEFLIEESKQVGHPIDILKLENEVIRSLLNDEIDGLLDQIARKKWSYKKRLIAAFKELKQIEAHYNRKELLIFPCLKKRGIVEPSKVMWKVDNVIRNKINDLVEYFQQDEIEFLVLFEKWAQLKEEIEEMIFKEEEIIFPMAVDLLNLQEWEQIARDSFEIGFSYLPEPVLWKASPASLLKEKEYEALRQLSIQKTKEKTEEIVHDLVQGISIEEKDYSWEKNSKTGEMVFPTGTLNIDHLIGIFQALPVDITFFDRENRVHFYSQSRVPIFPRTKSTVGRKAAAIYPSKNMHIVDELLNDFKAGRKEQAEYWMEIGERKIQIRYLSIKDANGVYLGCLEISQDVTQIQEISIQNNVFDSYVKDDSPE